MNTRPTTTTTTATVWGFTSGWANPVRKGSPLELIPLAIVIVLLLLAIPALGQIAEERYTPQQSVPGQVYTETAPAQWYDA